MVHYILWEPFFMIDTVLAFSKRNRWDTTLDLVNQLKFAFIRKKSKINDQLA